MTKKKKVISGPVLVPTKTQEPVIQETEMTPIPQVDEPSVEPVTTDVSESTELYPTVEDEAIKKADTTYKPYTPGNTAQHKIPWKYKLWGAIATVIAAILGIWIACSHTSLPVDIIPLKVECDISAGTALVYVDDKEHTRVDVFRDNALILPKYTFTPDGILYSGLKPGLYTFHSLEIQRSFIKYGVTSGNLQDDQVTPDLVSYEEITDEVKRLVGRIPDEGNKKDLCIQLAASFMTAASSTDDFRTIAKDLRERNDSILGFNAARPRLNDESAWYDLLKDKGSLSNYLDSKKIVVDSKNYKQLFTAVAKGLKESI